jgi:hypothetical protein
VESLELFGFHSKSSLRDLSHDGSGSADGIGLGFRLWLFLLGNSLDLIEVAAEDCCVGHILCGF